MPWNYQESSRFASSLLHFNKKDDEVEATNNSRFHLKRRPTLVSEQLGGSWTRLSRARKRAANSFDAMKLKKRERERETKKKKADEEENERGGSVNPGQKSRRLPSKRAR